MAKKNKNKCRSQTTGKSRDEVERKRDERARRNALKKEREVKEYLENDENFVSFSNQLQAIGYKIKDIKGDGNCLFRALADQLDGDDSAHLRHRRTTAKYMADHREEFEPFVEDNKSFDEHVKELSKPGYYVGNDSIVAFSRNHGVNIVIHQLNERCWVIQGQQYSSCKSGDSVKELHISYHNGDHYSSVRRIGDPDNGPAWIFNNEHKIKEKTFKCNSENPKRKPGTKNDTAVHCQGAECIPSEPSEISVIRAATGCEDLEVIQQTLCDSNNDLDATISYILQMQSIINIEEADPDKVSLKFQHLSVENEGVHEESPDIDNEPKMDQQESENSKSESPNNTPVSRNLQESGRPFQGARPKVKQQNLSNKKRKQLAKQEKKTRRMEERREEAVRKRGPQNMENTQTNQTLSVIADLEALAI